MLLLAGMLCGAPACAHRAPEVEAPLGRVVVYRNGVAYFERRATVDGSFSMDVPRARVDDFLKSLTVVDLSDGSPLAVSYQTPDRSSSRSVTMEIVLPPGKRDVLITYVTESPAWKPSYRLMLEGDGKATLQSLAIVDNVSNEEWKGVRVGVGTTSALSFRYDLHSVRLVERETVDEGRLLAQAPPKGGSAYAVDGAETRVLANLAERDLGQKNAAVARTISMEEFENIPVGESPGRDWTTAVETSATVAYDSAGVSAGAGPPPEPPLQRLVAQLQSSTERVRIEGRRLVEETDAAAPLRRANTLREQLIASGIAAQRIEVAEGRGTVDDPAEVLRVTAIDGEPTLTQAVDDADDDAPRGSALFVADQPLSLRVGHSAMVTLLEQATAAQRVYLFDPTSDRGSTRFAFSAVRILNPTEHTLDSGPVTVYAEERYLGEGLAEAIPPHARALVPYALDRLVRVRTENETRDEIQRLVHVERGVVTTDTERVRTTTLRLHNRGTSSVTVFVRHHVPSGWSARDLPSGTEEYRDDLLVPVEVGPSKHTTLTLTETMPLQSVIDLQTTGELVMVERYLASGRAPEATARQLQELVDAHARAEALSEKLLTAEEKVDALRVRTQELRDQLVLLRKSARAQSLSAHLAKRMRVVSDELDAALLAVSELKNDRLQARIELSSAVAELSLDGDEVVTKR